MKRFDHGYALLIGVNDCEVKKWALPGVSKDIRELETVLADPERCAYPEDNIKSLTGPNATRQDILNGLKWLYEKIEADTKDDTTAIVYYSGHGMRDTSADSLDFYLIPYDVEEEQVNSRSLQASDFSKKIDSLKPRRLLVILDCCHAGGMGVKGMKDIPKGYFPAAFPPAQLMGGEKSVLEPGKKESDALASGKGRAVLSSSTGTQKSYMCRNNKMSIFTYHLIEALTGHAQPKEGATEVLVSDVMSHVYRHVPKSAMNDRAGEQTPDYTGSGNFPIALLLGGKGLIKGQLPAAWRTRTSRLISIIFIITIATAFILWYSNKNGGETSIESKMNDSSKSRITKQSKDDKNREKVPVEKKVNLLKELRDKGLIKKLRDASAYCDSGNYKNENKALTLYREVIKKLSPGVWQSFKLLNEAENDFNNKYYDNARQKYKVLFDKVISDSGLEQ